MESELQQSTLDIQQAIKDLNDTPNRHITREQLYKLLFQLRTEAVKTNLARGC